MPKSIDELIKYLRESKGIDVSTDVQKKKLRYMGYFHGYKGYRYVNKPTTMLEYREFNELQAVYDFDMGLKALIYPRIMFIETAFKNYVLEAILAEANSEKFADIYNSVLNDYKSYPIGSREYKNAMKSRMSVRNRIYNVISRDYDKNNIINHYYDKDEPVPIWAIFELISLGDFGYFVGCLNYDLRRKISDSIGIKSSFDQNGLLLKIIIFTLKDLRNSIAHNNIIFDARFKTGEVNRRINNVVESETGIKANSMDFRTITDYIILIAFVMKILKCTEQNINKFISEFEKLCETLRKKIPVNIYNKIVYTNIRGQLRTLKEFF